MIRIFEIDFVVNNEEDNFVKLWNFYIPDIKRRILIILINFFATLNN